MASRQRGQWPVVAVHGAVAATVLALVAVLALVVNPPAPPGIAAFAPQAAKPITKAPPGQSAENGQGQGQCAAGQVCTAPTPTPTPVPGASASVPAELTGAAPPGLQCYTWPNGAVTQTFDPQSPPCIARWDDRKGNGGATTPGVTRSEIRVAFPVNSAAPTWPTLKPIVDFFNTRFQLYGRQIKVVPFTSQQADGQVSDKRNDPVLQRADASQITQLKVFATTDFIDPISQSWTLPVFLDVMAKHKIVSINGGEVTPYGTAQDLERRAPYAWSYYPTIDQLMTNIATMTCRQLVGKPAKYAPDEGLRSTTRKFAVFLPGDSKIGGPMPGLSTLLRILDGCGVHSPKIVRYEGGAANQPGLAANFRQLATDGVTSVIFFPYGGSGTTNSPMIAAQQVNFRPEWVLIGWNNYNTAYQLNDPETQTSGAFGVGTWNRQPQLALEPWHQAFVAGGGDPANGIMPNARAFYQEMLLLASGVQMAGPHLTPDSFARGLQAARFPNPGAGNAPFYQGTVGFSDRDTIMVDDYTAFWLDTRTSGQQVSSSRGINQEKAMCVVELGRRWTEDTWPRKDGFYQGPCR